MRLEIDTDEPREMRPAGGGWWSVANGSIPADTDHDYGYLIDNDERPIPDPRSRRQPRGVHGLSRTVDAESFVWTDATWTGHQLAGAVIYELHIGTFTPEGTLDAAVGRLEHLAALGVTHVELMPVNDFNGVHNWGYDGVLFFAVHEPYGGPAAYARFVDRCHALGLAVIQDVVYNHLGPSGNYLGRFGPYQHLDSQTGWGAAMNLDGDQSQEVRRYILDNARMFFDEYHVDGLRLDAVHALVDSSIPHILEELGTSAEAWSAHVGRPLAMIAESDLNDPVMFRPREADGYGLAGQWSDDFHHAVHVALTGEVSGYYADFEPLAALAKVLTQGFFHDGTLSSFRGRLHGKPIDTARTSTWRLVVAAQNHDQIGNRTAGDRLAATLDEDQLGIAAVLTLLGPFTPMLFMGEEWGASTPFQFFTSHPEPELGRATAAGRIAEFARMGWDLSAMPDPQDPATFQRSKLDWSEPVAAGSRHARLLALYQELTRLRRTVSAFTDPDFRELEVEISAGAAFDAETRWLELRRGPDIRILINFAAVPLAAPPTLLGTREVLLETVARPDAAHVAPRSATVYRPA